jgi:peptidoglycan hydrolase CwlO-like protein
MAHTHSQDLEAHLNTLSSDFTEAQKEVRQLSANITTINKKMHSTIDTKMETLKHDLSTQLESFTGQICAKMNITGDLTSSDPPLHPEGETSSNSQTFQSPSLSA